MRAFIDLRLLVLLALLRCITGASAADGKPVWLVSNGFHTSLALRTADAPELARLDGDVEADHLLIGWGEREFYRRHINVCTTLSAVLWVNASVLHLIPIRGPVAQRFSHSDVIRLALSPAQYRMLVAELRDAFARDRHGQCVSISRGYFPNSHFYAAREKFWLGKMCNTWVAQKLRRSGVPISVSCLIMAPGLMSQVARFGQRENRRSEKGDAF